MRSRLTVFPLALSILVGCSGNTNNYDSTLNPFDEPAKHRSGPLAISQSQLRPVIATPAVEPARAPARPMYDEAVAIPAPVSQAPKIEVSLGADATSPHIQELLDEADRLGSGGDVAGKADLLIQAGYSGSPKAYYDLARMYLDGSLPKDMGQAFKYISLAHDAGYDEATRVLGMLYLRGQGVPADEQYGRLLLEKASKRSVRASREYGQLLANLSTPELNDLELGIEYLRDAADRGDRDAALSLAKALSKSGRTDEAVRAEEIARDLVPSPTPSTPKASSIKEQALRGDVQAMYSYAQQVMLRKIPSSEPEFTAYCWLTVAEQLGSIEAGKELGFIRGVRTINDKLSPGRLDQCIHDLHYQIRGRE